MINIMGETYYDLDTTTAVDSTVYTTTSELFNNLNNNITLRELEALHDVYRQCIDSVQVIL